MTIMIDRNSNSHIREILICPRCKKETLDFYNNHCICSLCQVQYGMKNGKYTFVEYTSQDISDSYDKVKYFFKRYHLIYNFIKTLLSPVYFSNMIKLRNFLEENQAKVGEKIILNLGSGNLRISKGVTNFDIFAYDAVDIVGSIDNLPFKDNSVDIIVNIAVLEHIPSPEKVVAEIYRVLKNGGKVYSFFPFIQGFHASPYDFQRRTREGIKELFNQFKQLELKNAGGPTSGFLWFFKNGWQSFFLLV